jgi:hypothetical protein
VAAPVVSERRRGGGGMQVETDEPEIVERFT